MKADVLTIAAVVFVAGMVANGLGITDVFATSAQAAELPPSALQQGVVFEQN